MVPKTVKVVETVCGSVSQPVGCGPFGGRDNRYLRYSTDIYIHNSSEVRVTNKVILWSGSPAHEEMY